MCKKRRKTLNSKEMLEVSPSKKSKIIEIRQKTYSLNRTILITKRKVIELQKELINSQNAMSKYNNTFLEDKLKGMNDSQRTLIMECFSASKLNNPKSRRYSENWLMLCLLLNIRSPSTYNYLRSSALLPLPHVKTVRKHLSLLKSTCGFDPDFLRLLQKKAEGMLEKDKHGILMFDAVNLRKSIAVNSSNLTYSGLEDYGNELENEYCHKEYADHALVFMWRSLGSNFNQTIGCFASKGEVKGKYILIYNYTY